MIEVLIVVEIKAALLTFIMQARMSLSMKCILLLYMQSKIMQAMHNQCELGNGVHTNHRKNLNKRFRAKKERKVSGCEFIPLSLFH